jgi:hypothetical protein
VDERHSPRAEGVEAGGQLGPSALGGQVDPSGPQVTGIDADPEAGVATGGIEQLRRLLRAAGQRPPASGGELEEQVDTVSESQQPGQRSGHPRHGLGPDGAYGMAGVDDDPGGSDPRRPVQGEGGAFHRPGERHRVGRGQVHEVGGVEEQGE